MTFQPRMQNRISGFEVVGGWQRRMFDGVVADLWNVRCAPFSGGFYVADAPRLFVVLETEGAQAGRIAMRTRCGGALAGPPCRHLSFIPAGFELWAEMEGMRGMRHLDLHFDVDALSRRLGQAMDPSILSKARLMMDDPRLMTLAELLAGECASGEPLHALYGDGLALALFIALTGLPQTETRQRGALAPWQLRRVSEFIEAHCLRAIRLDELAALVGLSQSYFSHAFKVSTGMPPHRYQMMARIERAKAALIAGGVSLSDVAAETGFADQAHFTRAFRAFTGVTPGQWSRSRRS